MKTTALKRTKQFSLLLFLIIFTSGSVFSQWDSPGVLKFTHGSIVSDNQPKIQGFGGMLKLIEFEKAAAGVPNGLRFSKSNGLNETDEAYFHYVTNFNVFHMSKTGSTSDSKWSLDVDNGNMKLDGKIELCDGADLTAGVVGLQFDSDEAIWYNDDYYSWGFDGNWNRFADPITIGSTTEPPTSTALMTTNGNEIKMVGDNSYIQFHSSTRADPAGSNAGFIGSNQSGATFLESNLSKVVIDGETGLQFLVSDSYAMVVTSDKNVGIGTTAPGYKFQVVGDADITGELTAASDSRLKKNVNALSESIVMVKALRPVAYDFKTELYPSLELPSRKKMGFIAQEVEKVLPALVSSNSLVSDKNGDSFQSKSVNYIEMIPLLTGAIQEQQIIIEAQQAKINAQGVEMDLMKKQIEQLITN